MTAYGNRVDLDPDLIQIRTSKTLTHEDQPRPRRPRHQVWRYEPHQGKERRSHTAADATEEGWLLLLVLL